MKKIVALVLAAAMVFSLAACTKEEAAAVESVAAEIATEVAAAESEAATEAATEAAAEHTPVSIEVAVVADNWKDQWEEIMEPKFEAEYPWIDVVSVGVGPESGFMQARTAADDLPEIIWINADDITRELAAAGKLKDCSDTEAAKHVPQSYLDTFTFSDVATGITQGAAFTCMYVNMDALKKAGWESVPTNFDEWIQCCEDVKAKTEYDPLIVAGAKSTTLDMILEGAFANSACEALGNGGYEDAMRKGTFDFTKYPDAAEKVDKICQYFTPGSTTYTEDDVKAQLADGVAAMAIAGNWTAAESLDAIASCTGNEADAVACLCPFNDAGKTPWISVSPETGWGLAADGDDAAVNEAKMIFWEWIFQPENFAIMQNARGTVPVQDNMTAEYVVLPQAITNILADMAAAPTVLMSFNVWTSETNQDIQAVLRDTITGNTTCKDSLQRMTDQLKASHTEQ